MAKKEVFDPEFLADLDKIPAEEPPILFKGVLAPETPEEKMQFETERTEKKFALFFDLLEFVEQNPESYLAQKFNKVVNLAIKGK